MPTLLTDPRSGGVKKDSGVNVLPIIAETWAEVRNDNHETTYLLATYGGNDPDRDVVLHSKGTTTANTLVSHIFQRSQPESSQEKNESYNTSIPLLPKNIPVFGGMKLSNGKFASFLYIGDDVGIISRGRASMHKNGVLNILEGCGEYTDIEVRGGMTEHDIISSLENNINISNMMSDNVSRRNITNEVVDKALSYDVEEVNHASGESSITIDNQYKTNVLTITEKNSTGIHNCDSSTTKTVTLSMTSNTIKGSTTTTTIPYEKLQTMTLDDLMKCNFDSTTTMDVTKKELLLSEEEFLDVFQMGKESFYQQPKWKQIRLKKDKLLF